MDLMNAKGELVPDEPIVVVLLNPDGEVAQFSTNVSRKLTVIIESHPNKYKEGTLGLPFHSPPLAGLQSKKKINN